MPLSETLRPSAPTHVLIMEDDAETREMYEQLLTQFGFRVTFAASLPEALAHARTLRPNVITTDLGRRGGTLDGCELIIRLKASSETHLIPVLAVTGWTTVVDRDRAFRAGCDAVLFKPCQPDVLLAEIRRLLTVSRSQPSTV